MKKVKKLFSLVLVVVFVLSLSVVAFAADESGISAAMSSGLDTMKSELFALIGVVLPVGLLIFGAFFGVRKAISMLRATSGS